MVPGSAFIAAIFVARIVIRVRNRVVQNVFILKTPGNKEPPTRISYVLSQLLHVGLAYQKKIPFIWLIFVKIYENHDISEIFIDTIK